jgi:hypothetical protein
MVEKGLTEGMYDLEGIEIHKHLALSDTATRTASTRLKPECGFHRMVEGAPGYGGNAR